MKLGQTMSKKLRTLQQEKSSPVSHIYNKTKKTSPTIKQRLF